MPARPQSLPEGLFLPDIFSESRAEQVAARADEIAYVREVLEHAFPSLGPPADVLRCGALNLNSNNFVATTPRGKFLVKRLAPSGADEMERALRLSSWLAEQGLPFPRAERTLQGGFTSADDKGCGCVLEFVDGSHFTGAERELTPTAHLVVALAEALRRVPTDLRPTTVIPVVGRRESELLTEMGAARHHWNELLGQPYAELLAERWRDVDAALNEAIETEASIPRREGVCHADLHPHNLLVRDGRAVAVLDCASFRWARSEGLIAFGALKLLRQAGAALPRAHRTLHALRRLREAFLPSVTARSPELRESRTVGALARVEVVRRIFILFDLSLRGDRAWNHVLPIHLSTLDESHLLFDDG